MSAGIRVALIPAAGRGRRLDRPGTPKPIVDVGGKPMLFRLLCQLARQRVSRAVVVVGYEGDRVAAALARHPASGIEVEVVTNERWEAGLTSSILAARPHLEEPFVLAMADHVYDEELIEQVVDCHPGHRDVIALVDPLPDRVFDLGSAVKVRLDGARVVEMGFALDEYDAVDVGLFAATPAVFATLESVLRRHPGAEFSEALGDLCARDGVAAVHVPRSARWDDVDTPAALVRAERRLRTQRRVGQVARPVAVQWPVGAPAFEFAVPASTPARIAVGRGFVREPSRLPLIAPEAPYEVEDGFRNNVIFPGGMILEDSGEVKIYYGAADTVECLATADVGDLLKLCTEKR